MNKLGCPICGAEPDAYDTAFGYTIRHRADNHECAAFGDTEEEATKHWNERDDGWDGTDAM